MKFKEFWQVNIQKMYESKKMSAEAAIQTIPAKAVIGMGMRVATPPALCQAIAKRARAGGIEELKVYYLRAGNIAIQTLFAEDLMPVIRPYSSMLSKGEVDLAKRGFEKGKKYINFVPCNFNQYPAMIKECVPLDAFIVTVGKMDEYGYLNFGINGDYAIELSRHAKKLIVEVNSNIPRTAGATLLHISEVDALVENDAPLLEEPARPATELDHQISQYIVPLIQDGATIQMGIGGVPNAVCEQLTQRNDLGIHTEVMTSGMINLIQAGVVTNLKKTLNPYVNVFTFAIGDKKVYDFINNNPSMACLPVSYVNDPNIIGQHDNMISVNSFIEIDFSGQVNAEFMGHQFSGVGGQLDFIRGVHYSKGGKTILASSSTAKGESISKIIPRLQSVSTTSRLEIDYIATEYGCVSLKGKSTTERTHALISIAHPKFRDELLQQAKKEHFI